MKNKLASFENDINFPRIWRVGLAVSAIAMLLSVGGLAVRGLNLGIDFEGGTSWEVLAPNVSVSEARTALGSADAAGAKIQIVGGDTLRVQAEPKDQAATDAVFEDARRRGRVNPVRGRRVHGRAHLGNQISAKAERALVVFFVIISLYIALRLEWKMAAGALAAVVHDILLTVGFYALFQFEVTPATVIAVLTILGYSLYDTIVVYDKVKENADKPAVAQKMPYTEMMSLSLNQVLMRSMNTTITSLLPVLAMLFVGSFLLGAVTLQEFAIALAVGLISGAYSSIFIATPLVAFLKEREPYYRNLRSRLEGQGGRRTPAPVGATTATTATTAPEGSTSAPELSGRVIPPRPRRRASDADMSDLPPPPPPPPPPGPGPVPSNPSGCGPASGPS